MLDLWSWSKLPYRRCAYQLHIRWDGKHVLYLSFINSTLFLHSTSHAVNVATRMHNGLKLKKASPPKEIFAKADISNSILSSMAAGSQGLDYDSDDSVFVK